MFEAIVFLSILNFLYFIYKRDKSAEFGSPYLPLDTDVVERIMKITDIKKGDVFYDLGSGDGRVVIAAALRGAKAYGIEVSFFRAWFSRWRIFWRGLNGKAKIIRGNIFDIDLSSATVVNAYLLEKTNSLLLPKLERELKKGVQVVGVAFKFLGWKPVKIDPNGPVFGPIYLYRVLAKK